jgi:ABC-type molybdate transport system ATPase subunit
MVGEEGDYLRVEVSGRQLLATPNGGGAQSAGLVCIRAENVLLQREEPAPATFNSLPVTVVRLSDRGPYFKVELDAGFRLTAYVMKHGSAAPAPGTLLWAQVPPQAVHLIPL